MGTTSAVVGAAPAFGEALVASVVSAAPSGATSASQVSFAPATNYSLGGVFDGSRRAKPEDVAVGDFNGDGIADLVVVDEGCPSVREPYNGPCHPVTPGGVSVLLGMSDGRFGPATFFPVGLAPTAVAIGDFNRDGIADLAVASSLSQDVSVLLGTGTGSFGPPTAFFLGGDPTDVATGDFNGDGRADLAVSNRTLGGVQVLLGTRSASFGPPTTYPTGTWPQSVAVGDFNRDGIADLAVANMLSQNMSVLLGTGTGTFQSAMPVATVGSNPFSVGVGDFNGDGISDLAVTMLGSDTVSVSLGTGDGTFGAPNSFPAGPGVWRLAVGDFNADGIADLAVTNIVSDFGTPNDFVSVLLGTGTGSFGAPMSFTVGDEPVAVAVGDFNRDGQPDLAVANRSSDKVSVLLNNTSLTLSCSRVIPATGPSYVRCKVTDSLGIRQIRVVDLQTHTVEQSTAFSCSSTNKVTTTTFRIPDDGNTHRVVVTDCTTAASHSYLVAPDGTVT